MVFKINISNKGKTYKLETENEILVGKKIGETINGDEIDGNMANYQLEITGSSDLSGIPGFKGLEGTNYHRKLHKYGPGMKERRKGIRLRKTLRGEEISSKTHQINIKVIKEGNKKFDDLVGKREEAAEGGETSAEPKGEKQEPKETNKPAEEKSE